MPDGTILVINTDQLTIEFERDFMDASAFGDQTKVYQVRSGTFTIKGTL